MIDTNAIYIEETEQGYRLIPQEMLIVISSFGCFKPNTYLLSVFIYHQRNVGERHYQEFLFLPLKREGLPFLSLVT